MLWPLLWPEVSPALSGNRLAERNEPSCERTVMALYRRHDRDKDSRRKAAFVAALMPVPKAPKAIPGWLMAQFAEEAERERIRKAEIQEAADRARWLMKQGALGGCKWLQERGYQSDGRAPGVG